MDMTRANKTMDDLKSQLGAVQNDLYAMPSSKLGSEWHSDRCDEVRYLCRRIETLAAEMVREVALQASIREARFEDMWRAATPGI